MNQIRLGIIGYGNMGSSHAKNIIEGKTPEIALTAVCDIKESKRELAKKSLPSSVAVFSDAEEMMNSQKVDAVLVAVPHYSHPTLSIMAMKRGLHCLCEKPAGVYTLQVREMNRVSEECPNVTFAMMFNQRTNPMYIRMKEIVDSGEMGAIKRVNWIITDWYRTQQYYDSGDWRATWSGEGGGVLLNQCPHQLDLLQWICGLPKTVSTRMHFGKWHNIEVEDDVTAYLEFENGATGVFVTSTGDAPGTNRLELTMEKGKMVAEGGKLTLWKSKENEREWCFTEQDGFKKPPVEVSQAQLVGQNTQHIGVLNAFAAHILHGDPLIADGKEGIRGLTLSNAMHLSAFTGKPVSIPFDEEEYYRLLMEKVKHSRRKETVSESVTNLTGTY